MTVQKTLLVVFAAMAIFFLLMVGIAGFFLYRTYQQGGAEITPRIDALFQAIDEQDFGSTYLTETTSELRNTVTLEGYENIGKVIAAELGKLESKTISNFKYQFDSAGTFYDVSYDARFEKGTGTIHATLKKVEETWKLHNFRVNSPLLIQDLKTIKCRACGEGHDVGAKFCPHCGAAFNAKKSPAKEEPVDDVPIVNEAI